ncbi:hypothetical protein [Pseudooceanicola spongiae]|uniref:Uncharacterized protein n=1 Tax=Pseudooceanicola spongiae TaxID=2613965 RepID=A0A7L9WU99_9RHOB|nr:hypothetical protein [Pseudooceanicola spongiae]QOL82660.1 hypothetical protein F3W81_18645 [Pseudooceanicola spongiae]
MPEMISPENQEVIARELAARDVSPDTINWAIKKLDFAARRFAHERWKPSRRTHNPPALVAQINKVKELTGEAQEKAICRAKDMGLDPEAIDLISDPRRANSLIELVRNQEILSRIDQAHFEEFSNRTCPLTNRFQVICIGVWLGTGGEIRFSNNQRNDGGPLGRFLTAALTDAYRAAKIETPTSESLRKKIPRLKAAVDTEGFDWESNFSQETQADFEDCDDLDFLDGYFDQVD